MVTLASTIVIPTTSRRLCAVRFVIDNCNFLFINVYLPHESSDNAETRYAEELAEIEDIISTHSSCHLIIGGDLNVDLSRQSANTTMLKSFCDENSLSPLSSLSLSSLSSLM